MKIKGEKHPLSKKDYSLLVELISSPLKQSNKIFDKKDNCFTDKTVRELEKLTGHSKSKLSRLFQKLQKLNLTKKVLDSAGNQVVMLSPFFIANTTHGIERNFKFAMFTLGSHDAACHWSNECRKNRVIYDLDTFNDADVIDFDTGEVVSQRQIRRKLSQHEIYQWDKYRQSYSSVDRTKRRHSSNQVI
ncbi:MarR family transcriptional regulator [Vibrio fluvialis]|uniref:MarR family transcriptional regulator n=1 Tax=Vibrio fluvialis TaxID=676 RepID=UPI00155936D6|nr:MarR family transcriptional regulator [Vibrio fluvialis]